MARSSGTRDGRDEFGPIVTGRPALFRGVKWLGGRIPAEVVRADLWPVTGRAGRIALAVATGLSLVFALWAVAQLWIALGIPGTIGVDLHTYRAAAENWLAGDGFYNARQLAGPYELVGATTTYIGDVLYPPTLLFLLVPFTLLPDILWWAVPAVLVALAFRRMQPAPWTWPLIALLATLPPSSKTIIWGNPVMWIVAGTWLGAAYGWGGAFVWLKPSLFPFALFGIRDRRWWLACGLLIALTLPMLPLVFEYAHVVLDLRGGGLLYSLPQVPLLLTPVVAWAARSRARPPVPGGNGR